MKNIFNKKDNKENLKTKIQENIKLIKEQSDYYLEDKEILNSIQKMAIWFEFKYPNGVLYDMYHDLKLENYPYLELPINSQVLNILTKELLKTIFSLNNYSDNFPFSNYIDLIHDEIFDLLNRPKFENNNRTYLLGLKGLNFSTKGKILGDDNFKRAKKYIKGLDDSYIGKDVSSIFPLISEDYANELKKDLKYYHQKLQLKELLLNSVLYQIIKNGGGEYGAIRGYLFAKEFKLDINIPFKYITINTPKKFINEYLENEESILKELYIELPKTSEDSRIEKEKKNELKRKILILLKNDLKKYEQEMLKLKEERDREEIKRCRLERNLNKSKSRRS